jgi:hypothetical protein
MIMSRYGKMKRNPMTYAATVRTTVLQVGRSE